MPGDVHEAMHALHHNVFILFIPYDEQHLHCPSPVPQTLNPSHHPAHPDSQKPRRPEAQQPRPDFFLNIIVIIIMVIIIVIIIVILIII